MPRNILDEAHVHPDIRPKIHGYYATTVNEVQAAIAAHDVVIVGMKQNPWPKKARQWLDAAGVRYTYLEYGSYLGDWRRRLALKMWTGWPTFPMVFVRGTLVGGAEDVKRLVESGGLTRMLSEKAAP
jgi:glutaredoxin-related protein